MPLDPQAQAVMDQVASLGFPPAHTVSPQQARANNLARPRAKGPDVARVEDRSIPGPQSQLPIRIYTPEGSYTLYWFLPRLYNPDNFRNNKDNVFGDIISVNMVCIPESSTLAIKDFKKVDDSDFHPMRRH